MTSTLSQKKRVFNATNSNEIFQKWKYIFDFFLAFPESTKNFEHFEKKYEPQTWFVSQTLDCKNRRYLNALKAQCQNTYGQSTCQRVQNTVQNYTAVFYSYFLYLSERKSAWQILS